MVSLTFAELFLFVENIQLTGLALC